MRKTGAAAALDELLPAVVPAYGSSPASNRLNPSSSRMGTPSSVALASFEPAPSPAITYEVFFETELAALPPAARTASSAAARSYPARLPVTTTVLPASGPAAKLQV